MKSRILALCLPVLLLTFMVLPAAAEELESYNLISIEIDTVQKLHTLQAMGVEIVHMHPGNLLDVVVFASDLEKIVESGLSYELKIEDMAAYYAERLKSASPTGRAFPDGSMGGNYTLSEIEGLLDGWAAQYPHLISPKMSIGTSIQGRDIWAVKISDNPTIDEQEPECSFDALIHAREPQSMMTLVYYMIQLLEQYGVDPELTYLVDNREIWFIPCHNPDGYYYNQQTNPNGGGMWRKNRRLNTGGSYGVDLNRNYGYQWGYDNYGSSPTPSSETYRGTGPFSEPATQAVRDFILGRPIVTSWNTHTYSNLYMCPFGYDRAYPTGNDWNIYQEYLADISAQNGYQTGTIYDVLYSANGGATDWHYASAGVFNITPEIGSSGDGFWPSFNRIVPLAQENLPAIKYFSWVAGSYVLIEDSTFADDNGDGYFFPGEPVAMSLTLRNKGLAATTTNVIASVSSSSPYVNIQQGSFDFGSVPSVTTVNNTANPLVVVLDPTTPYGESIALDVDLDFDGYTLTVPFSLTCGLPRVLAGFDMESDPGWTVGDIGDNATAGIWERDDPIGTVSGTDQIQPENDHTPAPGTQCFVTGNNSTSAGGDDVDNGKTTLKSALIDLSGISSPAVSYWRWYADLGSSPNNDIFQVDISNDGGNTWINVESLDHTENSWEQVTFNVEDYIVPSANVMMRFIAKDEPNDSLCEACIDDFEVKTFDSPVTLTLFGTPVIGTTVNILVDAPEDPGLEYMMAASLGTYPAYPLNGGYVPLRFDAVTKISIKPGNGIFNNFRGFLDNTGYTADPEFVIPNNPAYVGLQLFIVALTLEPSGFPQGVKNISAPLPITLQ